MAGLADIAGLRADPLSAVQTLREGGCGGIVPAAAPLWHDTALDRVAEQWAGGVTLAAQAVRSGYAAESLAGVRVSAPDSSILELLRRSSCGTVTNRRLREIGVYRHGEDSWLVLASARIVPASSRAAAPAARAPVPAPHVPAAAAAVPATRALQLVNDVRARGTRCGARLFAPAPPVRLSGTLADVALGHAADMAEHNYFAHQNLSGLSPAERVRAVGYREKLVGENIAYGPKTVAEVVQGWLDSPGHCENIMDPRFAEMGIAYAPGQSTRRGLYWVQLLVAPQA
jgi:uncharacterized protein YkwD